MLHCYSCKFHLPALLEGTPAIVGRGVGCRVGAEIGKGVGDAVGVAVGLSVGDMVGGGKEE